MRENQERLNDLLHKDFPKIFPAPTQFKLKEIKDLIWKVKCPICDKNYSIQLIPTKGGVNFNRGNFLKHLRKQHKSSKNPRTDEMQDDSFESSQSLDGQFVEEGSGNMTISSQNFEISSEESQVFAHQGLDPSLYALNDESVQEAGGLNFQNFSQISQIATNSDTTSGSIVGKRVRLNLNFM